MLRKDKNQPNYGNGNCLTPCQPCLVQLCASIVYDVWLAQWSLCDAIDSSMPPPLAVFWGNHSLFGVVSFSFSPANHHETSPRSRLEGKRFSLATNANFPTTATTTLIKHSRRRGRGIFSAIVARFLVTTDFLLCYRHTLARMFREHNAFPVVRWKMGKSEMLEKTAEQKKRNNIISAKPHRQSVVVNCVDLLFQFSACFLCVHIVLFLWGKKQPSHKWDRSWVETHNTDHQAKKRACVCLCGKFKRFNATIPWLSEI